MQRDSDGLKEAGKRPDLATGAAVSTEDPLHLLNPKRRGLGVPHI